MKSRFPLYLILAIVVLPTLFQLGRWFATSKPRLLALDLAGTAGASVTGYYVTDGASNYVNGSLPLQFSFRTRELACAFTNNTAAGPLTLRVSGMGSKPAMASGPHGVRAAIRLSTFGRSIELNGF